jgi:type IX secretion system PorP/SprF family membrane protein
MGKPYLIWIAVILMLPMKVAGQDAIFSQFFSSPLYLNPAFAGAQNCNRLVMNYRNHPYPDFGTFSTFNFSYDQFARSLSGGVGLMLTSDHQGGLLMKNQLSAVYAYHLQVAQNLFINFGAQAGYYRKDLNWNRLVFSDQWDPFTGETLPQTETPPDQTFRHAANFATGILVYSDVFYGGLAAHHLTQPQESFFSDYRLPIKYTAHFGMTIYPGSRGPARMQQQGLYLSPNIIAQSQDGYHRINYGLYAGAEPLVGGLWLRQNLRRPDSLIFLLGITHGNYRVGYSYDYSLSGFSGGLQGAHEISVSLNLHCGPKNMKYRILNCPSF